MADAPTTPEAPENDPGTPPAASEGAPAPDAPQTETPEIDWQQRYEDLRPEADRRASLLADLTGQNGLERQAQALAEHAHIELADGTEDPEDEFDLFEDEPDPSAEIAEVRQELAERDAQVEAEGFEALEAEYCDNTVKELEGSEKFELTDDEYEFVVNRALANRDPQDGKPDLEGSFKAFKESAMTRSKNLVDGKESVTVPPIGTSGEPKIDLRDKEARQKLGTEIYEAAERAKT